ncbi:MAG TPA: polysaccharide biosynthesis protein [Candidatus Acidoferrum sp.]
MTANNGHSNPRPPTDVASPHEVILITGAGGSIGSALAKHLLASKVDSANSDQHVRAQHGCAPAWQNVIRTIVLLDHSEQNLYEIHSDLSSTIAAANASPKLIPILGDINDAPLLTDLFEKYRPTQIFHAAAFKHVPLMEENPIAVIRNNILGTWNLASAALKHRARNLTMISTDKAANPRSIMGAAKRVAELILARLDTPATRMRSIRLGNVLGSTGSVVPLFQQQIARGGPVTVTHPDARRYFLSLEEATNLILAVAALEDSGTLFIPELDVPIKILDLAKKMIREAASSAMYDAAAVNASGSLNTTIDLAVPNGTQIEIVFTGLRPGDKLSEDLLSSSETAEQTTHPKLRRILGPTLTAKSLDSSITLISEKIHTRDFPALLDAIRSLVPDYQPSALISAQISTQLSATAKA